MICNICGGSESYIQDGVEYCRECSEQVKGSIDEVAGDEACIKKALLSSPASKKEKKDKAKIAPWLHFEAYNLILCKQVSALVKLGCSEKLKTVVLSLWARYLQKCELAFIISDKKEEFIPRLSLYPSKRDLELLYGEGLSTNLRKIRRPHFKIRRRVQKRRKKDDKQKVAKKILKIEKVESSEDISDHETLAAASNAKSSSFLSDSVVSDSDLSGKESPESSVQNSVKMKKKKPHILYSLPAKNLKKKGQTRANVAAQEVCVSHMTLSKTLSFCHLGLLYTEDRMLPFDLIRLVNEGAVPYIDVIRHFPTKMQLQGYDYRYFIKSSAPDLKYVYLTSTKLMDFLQSPNFKQPPLLPIAIRFVKDLNLPSDLIPVLNVLINKVRKKDLFKCKLKSESRQKISAIPIYEAQAMSVVAVALKMLFVLDGKFEIEHSEIMKKLNSISEDQKFFVWKDWQQQMALKEYLFVKEYTAKKNNMNRLDSLCADRINGGYPVNLIHPELNTLVTQVTKNDNTARNELKSLFEGLVVDNPIKRNPTSFPIQYELHCLMRDWRRLPLFKDTENIDFSFISKDFSSHKLYYRPSASTDEPMDLLLSVLYESVKLVHVTDQDEYYENIIRTTKKYWYVSHTDIQSVKNKKWIDDFPSSFKWLFNFMCKYLQIDKLDFYREFRCIEQKLVH